MTNAEVLNQVEHGYRMQSPPGCPPALYEVVVFKRANFYSICIWLE
jgi:hypothetical protein